MRERMYLSTANPLTELNHNQSFSDITPTPLSHRRYRTNSQYSLQEKRAMAAIAIDLLPYLSPYLFRLAESVVKLHKEDDKTFFFELHKQAADRSLACNPSKHSEILALKEPISQAAVIAAFNVLSNLQRPNDNIGDQYELAQKAHDC